MEPDPPYIVELLNSSHDRARFHCGIDVLDMYIQQQAGQDMKRGLATVYILVDTVTRRIAGYYTLSATAIEATGLTEDVTKRLPRYPTLPATLLGRLARDQQYRGKGVGDILLIHALRRSLRLSREIASITFVVDAIDDAARAFYEQHEFRRSPDQEYRLFLMMRTIEKLFPSA